MSFYQIIIIVFVFTGLNYFSQNLTISKYEKQWALAHPVAALTIKKINKQCRAIYANPFIRTELDSFSSGGKLDAYRHVFFMAAFSRKIKPKKLRKLGVAHEKTSYLQFLDSEKEFGERPDSLGSVMDLKNNETGFQIGSRNKKLRLEELSTFVIKEIKTGNAVIMKRKRSGEYLDCENKQINLNSYSKKWWVPKCLVSSDYAYRN